MSGVPRRLASRPSRALADMSSLGRRVTAITAAALLAYLLVAVITSLSLLGLRHAIRAQTKVATPAALAAKDFGAAVVDEETGVRGYLLTGEESFLAPYRQGVRAEQQARRELGLLLTDDQMARSLLRSVEAATIDWHARAVQSALRLGGQPGTTPGERRASIETGKSLFDELRGRLGTLEGHLVQSRRMALDDANRARYRLELTLLVSLAGLGALLVGALVLFRRWVLAPLRVLRSSVEQVQAEGQFSVPAGGPRELARLGREIEAMRGRLASALRRAERANDALRQEGPLVVALREQLAPAMAPVPDLEAAGQITPAEGVLAGDWYDIIDLGNDRWAMLVADVAGHGAEAGILALRLKQLLVPALADGRSPGDALGWVAARLGDWGERFATAVVVAGRHGELTIEYANAGHPPAFACQDETVVELPHTGPLLSDYTRSQGWQTLTRLLPVGAQLVVYTDGLIEARDANGAEFGTERLRRVTCTAGDTPPGDVLRAAQRAVRDFRSGPARDDETLLVIRRLPVARPISPRSGDHRAAAAAGPAHRS